MMQDRSYAGSGRPRHCFKARKGTEEGAPYLPGAWEDLCAIIYKVQEFTSDCLGLEGEQNTTP